MLLRPRSAAGFPARLLGGLGVLMFTALPLWAQELAFGWGQLHPAQSAERTYSWQIQYLQPLSGNWSASLTWLNEGHLQDHHRDGCALQLWRFHQMTHNKLRLGLGLGTYRYCDTTAENAPTGYQNQHGYKTLASLRAQYPLAVHWDAFLQLNRTEGEGDPQTQGVLLGLSYRVAPLDPADAPRSPGADAKNELAFYAGRTILNSFESQSAIAYAIEYRRRLTGPLEFTATYSNEGDTVLVDRDGLALQLWGVADLGGGWGVGFGIGPYFSRVFPKAVGDDSVEIESGLRMTMGLHYRLAGHWMTRLNWNRTLTHTYRDTDGILAGVGYCW